MSNVRIAYIVNNVAFFVSHRLPIAIAASNSGFETTLITGQAGSPLMEQPAEIALANANVTHQRLIFESTGTNLFIESLGLLQLIYKLRRYSPQLLHCASPKGVLYGALAAKFCNIKGIVLAISGMGYIFTNSGKRNIKRIILQKIYLMIARIAFKHPNIHIIVQNLDDKTALISNRLVNEQQITLIPGSGVKLTDFANISHKDKKKIVLLPARMLRDKGINEFVQAARIVKAAAPEWRFLLAGAADYKNPSSISIDQLMSWQKEGFIEWLGHIENMIPLFKTAAIVCLPSYREGMPKSLLEAAAAGAAIVTTNVVGCREAILPGITGDLVDARDADALASALLSLINNPQKIYTYGAAGRELAANKFSLDAVINQTLVIYKEMLKND